MAALETVFWLLRINYKGHIYFDTFPRNEDPVREAAYNIRQFKRLYAKARRLLKEDNELLKLCFKRHDSMMILEYLEEFRE